MAKKQHVTKSGDTFEWEETPEVVAAVANLHKSVKETERRIANLNLKRPHTPSYAPLPDVKKLEEDAAPDYGVGK